MQGRQTEVHRNEHRFIAEPYVVLRGSGEVLHAGSGCVDRTLDIGTNVPQLRESVGL